MLYLSSILENYLERVADLRSYSAGSFLVLCLKYGIDYELYLWDFSYAVCGCDMSKNNGYRWDVSVYERDFFSFLITMVMTADTFSVLLDNEKIDIKSW